MGAVDKSNLDLSVLFPSEYLKAEDLRGKQYTVQITALSLDLVPMTGGRKEKKLVLKLHRTPKKLIVGKTNAYSMALLFCQLTDGKGPDLHELIGKRITLCADVDRLKGQEVPALRISTSPDALPGRAAAYNSAWRGERKGGALIGRVKRAIGLISIGQPPPIEEEEREQEQQHESQSSSGPVEDIFAGGGDDAGGDVHPDGYRAPPDAERDGR